jgi:hypothetical protein
LGSVDEVAFVVVAAEVVRENLKGSAGSLSCVAVSGKGSGEAWKMATIVLSPQSMEALVTGCTSVEARTTLLHVPRLWSRHHQHR